MKTHRQENVGEYAMKHFGNNKQKLHAFHTIMKKWDGSNDVWFAFYDMDVLNMKRDETNAKF